MLGKNKSRLRARRVESQSPGAEKSSGLTYYSSRNPGKNDQSRRDRQPDETRIRSGSLFWSRIITLLIGVSIIAILGDLLWLDNQPKLTILNGSTNVLMKSKSTYEIAAQKIINSSLVNRNKVTINVSAITSGLEKEFPEIANATLTLPFTGHQIQIYLQPSNPQLLVDGGSGVFAVNNNGVAIGQETAPTMILGNLGLPKVNDEDLSVKTGQQALSSGDVAFVEYVISELRVQHLNVTSLTLPPASRELDVVVSDQHYYIKFNLQNSAEEQVGSYITTQQYLSKNNITPAQYIDVRVPGRAYYK